MMSVATAMVPTISSSNKAFGGCSFCPTILMAKKARNTSGEFHCLENFPEIVGKSTWNIISDALIVSEIG